MKIRMVPLVVSCCVIACGRGEKPNAGSGTTGAVPPPTPSAGTTAAAPQAVTGKTWDVKMIGDATGYRFDPASLTIKVGDGVRWTVVSTPPHNVTFWPDSIPSGANASLQANMQQTTAPLTGPLLINPSQTYLVSFSGARPGEYHYYCTPHLAVGMKGVITVQ
jgi:plastocyanin